MHRTAWTPAFYDQDCHLNIPVKQLRAVRKVALIGAGDVGLMMSVGLLLYGRDRLEQIMIYTPDEASKNRLDHELRQICSVSVALPEIRMIEASSLAEADMVFFVASRTVPQVGQMIGDMRMVQFKSNWLILRQYVEQLESEGFKGFYGIVSDPVDLLGTKLIRSLAMNPERVIGFGQGVMAARARYYGGESIHMYGPHGRGLFIANDTEHFDETRSVQLSELTLQENLLIRSYGFKPFIAPALSSAAISFIDLICGRPHDASYYLGEVLWGERYQLTDQGLLLKGIADLKLRQKVAQVYQGLVEIYEQSDSQ